MPGLFRLIVDEERLTDELFAFVTDPRGTRGERPVIQERRDVAPHMVPVLEHMVLDGVDEREHVAAYVQAALGRVDAPDAGDEDAR